MSRKQRKEQEELQMRNNPKQDELEYDILRKKTIKELIAPSGIDASNIDHLEIISNTTRYARSFFVSNLPRMCTFPELFRDMYLFGDINTSVYINPVPEARSQNELNRVINQLETERIVAADRGNINRESILSQKRLEAEGLRDEIAAGFNKLFEASIVATLFTYNLQNLEAYSKLLATELSKTLVGIKSAWAMQDEAFQSNVPLMKNQIKKTHTFDRNSMATVFPFTTSEVGHLTGIPLGMNKQTGVPILFDNFHPSLANYNMVVFAKSGAGKSVTMKTLISRSAVLMGIESLALDAEGEYKIVAESLGGINVVISPTSNTIINLFDIEEEKIKDEITGRERTILNVENKIEDVTQALITMARGSTRSDEVNELTKQIIAEAVAEEYTRCGITADPNSLYVDGQAAFRLSTLTREKKKMPTIGSWYKTLLKKAEENTDENYTFHYSYLKKVMKQYVRELNGQMAYFDGQSTFDLLEGVPFIKLQDGGHQEKNKRAGTENTAGIIGLGKAIELAYKNIDEYNDKLQKLRDYYISEVEKEIPGAVLNGHRTKRLPGNANISFKGINGGDLLLELDEKGICASTGSACNTGSTEPSHVLVAIGLRPEYLQGSLRITFGEENTKADVDYLVSILKEIIL